MVLLNFVIRYPTNGRLQTTITNPLQCGRYKVKVVFINCFINNYNPTYIGFYRLDSKELIDSKRTNGGYGFYFLPQSFTGLEHDDRSYCNNYEWEVYLSSPTITIDMVPANVPPNGTPYVGDFQSLVYVLDFTKLD